jgi:hypothetical protein
MNRYYESKNEANVLVELATDATDTESTPDSVPLVETDYEKLLAKWQTKIVEGTRLEKIPSAMSPKLSELPDTDTGVQCSLRSSDSLPAKCSFGTVGAPRTAVIFGDSLSRAIYQMVINTFNLEEWHIIPINEGVCMVADVVPWFRGSPFTECVEHRNRAFALIDKIRPDILILADAAGLDVAENGERAVDRDQVWESGLARSVERLTKSVRKIIYFGTPTGGPSLLDCVDSNENLSESCSFDYKKGQNIRDRQSLMMQSTGGLFIDPTIWMCVRFCPPIIDNTPVFWDGLHFTPEFAEKLAPLFRAFLVSNNLL